MRLPLSKVRLLSFLALVSCVSAGAVLACGDDDNAVRTPDAGIATEAGANPDASLDGSVSSCGATIPAAYTSAAYETNAAQELALRQAFATFVSPMSRIEAGYADGGTPDGGVTVEQLAALFVADAGGTSVRAASTVYYQGNVDALLADFVAAYNGGAPAQYTPAAQAPGARSNTAGTSVWMFNARGVDIRQKVEKGLYNAAFFNHAASLVAAGKPITEATIDRLVAAFGAHPSFPNSQAAPQNRDINAAGYAARRDSNDPAKAGPYQRARDALIKAKASVAAGEKCNADRDAAIKAFFLEWEKSQYATVVYYLVDNQKKLAANPQDIGAILHAHGEVLGFISGFRTIDPSFRKITDAQIDALLQKAYAPEGAPAQVNRLITDNIAEVLPNIQGVIADVKSIYGFSDVEMKDFETNYP